MKGQRKRWPFLFVAGPVRKWQFLAAGAPLLIQADGRRLFYSADFQAHGRKAAIFEELLRKPPMPMDVLLWEGTNLRPEGDPKSGKTEQEIEKD